MPKLESELDALERRIAECGGVAKIPVRAQRRDRVLAAGVDSGRLIRLRRGWYALPGADPAIQQSVRTGGTLTAVSAAKRAGLWVIDDGRLHVAVGRSISDAKSSRDRAVVCVHHGTAKAVLPKSGHPLPIAVALMHLAMCQPFDHAIAAIDSALNKRMVTRGELISAFAAAPARCRRAVEWCDPNAQSGTESMVRVRLRSRGLRVRTQVLIDRVGFVDLLVGDRLVIECDSREFHAKADSYAVDRARDLELLRHGYRVIRLTYGQIVYRWSEVEPTILDIVRSGQHLWPRRRG